ncbi:hypothetical protein PHMEG_00011750 [Phytophthora megakarya]|uniref:Uncharacterized protein n=1 Tax=Phytophthora megakarya TaxID=4795 RepID=A0A225WCL0_9STRA|nr:hypothetical protein PHMEG_00011750 [Phytophthora megakarya]
MSWKGSHNHILSAFLFHFYADNRKITDSKLLQDGMRIDEAGASVKGILQYLRKQTGT